MDTNSILSLIHNSKKKTPVKVYIQGKLDGISFGTSSKVLNMGGGGIVIGDWEDIKLALDSHKDQFKDYYIESDRRNSAIDLLDVKDLQARIEPGAIIREGVEIESDAVVMMGACVNIGVKIGEKTMIDMNAVIGGRASIGKRCHIGAGAIIKGVISSPTAEPVVIEDDVVIGPNAIIMEGIRIGKGAVVRPGVIVMKDVQEGEII